MTFKGKTHVVGDHIDTDAIIPARFLVTADTAELGKNCFEGLEEGWVKRVAPGDILVAGENFGCGSSREHAPLAIIGAGMPVVLAKSYARIFYRNAINIGLPIIVCDGDFHNGDALEVDLSAGTIQNKTTGESYTFPPFPPFLQKIIEAGGLMNAMAGGEIA